MVTNLNQIIKFVMKLMISILLIIALSYWAVSLTLYLALPSRIDGKYVR